MSQTTQTPQTAPARTSVLASSGDSISSILGTSDPTAVEAFMRANGLSDSTIYAGERYVMPSSADYAASTGEMGQAALNRDNARIAAQTSSYDSLPVGDYGLSTSGLAVGPQDLYAMRPVSERFGSGEPMMAPTAFEQIGEGAYNKLQAQWDSASSAAVNAWQQLSTDPIGTLMHGTGAVLSFAGNAVYDTALYASDQIAVSANLLTSGLIPATNALQRNVGRTESIFGAVYNIEQAVDSKDYALAGGLAVAGLEETLVTLITRGRGRLFDGLDKIPESLSRTQLGQKIGKGGEKDIFSLTTNENLVVGVHRDGFVQYAQREGLLSPIAKPSEISEFLTRQLTNEVKSLNALDKVGIPVVKNYGVIDVDGAPGILLDKVPGAVSTHDLIRFNNPDALKLVLNQSSVADLQLVRSRLIENNIGATDLQFLVRNDGRVFANDPGVITQSVNPRNLSEIDRLIELARQGK